MKKLIFLLLISLASLNADRFSQGDVGIGILVGGGSLSTNYGVKNYTILGASADYFVIDDLSVGIGYTGWFGSSPTISQLTIPLNYYIPLDKKLRPYIGTFYRYTFIGKPYEDYSSFGAKAGVSMQVSKKAYLGAGWVQEYYDNCSNFKDCSAGYLEVSLIFSF